MTTRLRQTLPVLLAVLALLGACTSPRVKASRSPGPSATPGATPSAAPSVSSTAVAGTVPGHDSPAAALAGLIAEQVDGDNEAACSYVLPSQQAACPGILGLATATIQGSPVTFGDTYVMGDQALVVPLGTICLDTSCRTNSDRRLGLPANDAGFAAAYNTASTTDILTTGCQKVQGKWYVDLGPLPTDNQPI